MSIDKRWDGVVSVDINELYLIQRKLSVVCEDGFKMSVQASEGHYCLPREDLATAYTQVEVGYPTHVEEMLQPYAENWDEPTGTVYGWVPAEVIFAVINKHGGMVGGQLPPLQCGGDPGDNVKTKPAHKQWD